MSSEVGTDDSDEYGFVYVPLLILKQVQKVNRSAGLLSFLAGARRNNVIIVITVNPISFIFSFSRNNTVMARLFFL